MRLMVVVAHPDDEVLGAGGLILNTLYAGGTVKVVIMNGGGIDNRPDMEKDLQKSHKIMGVNDCVTFNYQNLLLSNHVFEMVKDIENEIKEFKPDYIVTHFYGDIHPDHVAVYRAVEQASRFSQRKAEAFDIKGLLCMDVPSSTNWGHIPFKPEIYVNVEKQTMIRKMEALKVYKNVVRSFPHPRSEEAVIAHCISTGSDVGYEYAEGFMCIWLKAETTL